MRSEIFRPAFFMNLIPQPSHFDLNNPQHFINLVPDRLREAILAIPEEFFTWNEKKMVSTVYAGEPPDEDYQLRLGFWEEYERCFPKMMKMKVQTIVEGVCSTSNFYTEIIHNKGRLLFIITEPPRTQRRMKYAHHLAMEEMLNIIKTPITTDLKTGLPDTKLMLTKYKIFEYLDQRIHGTFIQRIEAKSLNVNVDASHEQIDSPEEIDRRLNELEEMARLESAKAPPPAPMIELPVEAVIVEAGRTPGMESKR